MLHHDGGGPRRGLVARHLEALPAGSLVEGDEKRRAFVIPVDDQSIAVKGGRAALAVPVLGMHVAQIGFP